MFVLPTHSEGTRPAAAYRDAVGFRLGTDDRSTRLCVFAYAITTSGWKWLKPRLLAWRTRRSRRRVELFLGLDNDATHPDALEAILKEYPRTSFIVESDYCFHPKAFMFRDAGGVHLLSGSNNLSGPGLSSNFELGTECRVERDTVEYAALDSWVRAVRARSTRLTRTRIRIYAEEWHINRMLPRGFRTSGALRAQTRRRANAPGLSYPHVAIVEALTETGGKAGHGRQLGLPWSVAQGLFGLKAHSHTSVNAIGPEGTPHIRKVTYFTKVTYRLTIPELATAKRPCVVVLALQERPRPAGTRGRGARTPLLTVRYGVISRNKNPDLFATLFDLCHEWPKTRKRWQMFESTDRVHDLLKEALRSGNS